MLNTRVIPVLLLRNRGLVKTVEFKEGKYIGDPINAVKIFNEKEVDELIFLDITASKEQREPNFDLIYDIATECFMPFGYGGGIKTIQHIKKLFSSGAEKAVINSCAIENPSFIKEASDFFGSQSIVVSIDVKKSLTGKYKVYDSSKDKLTDLDPVDFCIKMESLGCGEIFLNSVERDGIMKGYDIELIEKVANAVNIPVIACGGAGKLEDFRDAVKQGNASAVAAGSLFVFYGKHKAVLINYPSQEELEKILDQKR
ncbi:MAG: imidazole glycerol phosphate synthase subunit HisF [Candidatus Altiarchaeales archaeon HGW-Altiarchaeales-1]|nr:MAG: imidazole glycerol phosphate synthase subunit HisF [Candidatus Altiarchaeales archaeon HGW-Altiarchaeales-1]